MAVNNNNNNNNNNNKYFSLSSDDYTIQQTGVTLSVVQILHMCLYFMMLLPLRDYVAVLLKLTQNMLALNFLLLNYSHI